jgi:hypothetical protein
VSLSNCGHFALANFWRTIALHQSSLASGGFGRPLNGAHFHRFPLRRWPGVDLLPECRQVDLISVLDRALLVRLSDQSLPRS